nr:AraC family transcriptional regulator [Haloferula luteola]
MGTLGKAAQAIHLIVRLRQALAEAVTLKSHQAPRSRHQNLPGELHEWLNAQWPHAPTIEEAAEHFSISRRHFSRALEQTSHFPYSRHLAVSRNLLARDLLIRSSDGIKEIAAACGFAGHEPFIRSFKEWTSWTPLQFRKEWQRRLKKQATLKELCQMGPRQRLAQQSEFPTEALPEPFPSFHTLIVANPHRTPLEVFHHPSPGVRHRMALLSEGQLHFLPSSEAGTIWQIESPHTNGPQFFTMPADHAEIVLETTRSS